MITGQQVVRRQDAGLVLDRYREAIREKKTVQWEETTLYPTGRKTGAVSVLAALIAGKDHPEADSTELAGMLSVTYKGTTQKIAIEGGVAC